MSSRSYLSIGDVLTLLRQEFPDITISKIRFLESQGLVNPERTPSGYRKFYEHDVERLRWVLRQQRENFLPLKVIKDRLDDDANGAAHESAAQPAPQPAAKPASRPTEQPAPTGADDAERAVAVRGLHAAGDDERVLVGHRSTTTAATASGSVGAEPASRAATRGATLPGIAAARTEAASRAALAGEAPTASTAAGPSSEPPRAADEHPGRRAGTRSGAGSPATEPGDGAGSGGRRRGADRKRGAGGPGGSSGTGTGPGRGTSLSLEELAAASGLDAEVLRELQEYGLLTATPVAGIDHFDQEALADRERRGGPRTLRRRGAPPPPLQERGRTGGRLRGADRAAAGQAAKSRCPRPGAGDRGRARRPGTTAPGIAAPARAPGAAGRLRVPNGVARPTPSRGLPGSRQRSWGVRGTSCAE